MVVAADSPPVAYLLHERQIEAMRLLYEENVNQLLYGGAAGGGKSLLLRAAALTAANMYPGARIAIFRDNYTQLRKTQVAAFRLEMRRLGYDVDSPRIWNETNAEFRIYNQYTGPTTIEFLHIDQSIGAEKWLSAEWAWVGIDESTQMPEEDIRLIYSRIRANDEQRKLWKTLADEREKYGGSRFDWVPRLLLCTNPGGRSHSFHKAEFVDPAHEGDFEPWDTTEELNVGGDIIHASIRKAFLPSFLKDNPSLDLTTYAASLANLPKERREQMLAGDWNFFEGKVFGMLDPNIHWIDARWPFGGNLVPPAEWTRVGGMDHGTTNPTAAIWTTRDEDGFFIAYLEYYQPGPVGLHIEGIRSRMEMDGNLDLVFEADPRMWHKTQGIQRVHSLADEYLYGGEPPDNRYEAFERMKQGIRLHKATIERQAARVAMQRLLEPQESLMFPDWHPLAGQYGAPRLFIARQCPNLWRELNGIQYAGNDSEETVKEDDHAYDAASRSIPLFEHRVHAGRARGPRRTFGFGG